MPVDCENSWFWKRLLPTNASWWELAAAAITVVFAFRHAAISSFYARFNVSPEEIGLGLTTVALHSAVLVVGLYIAANWLLVGPIVYFYARFGAKSGRRLKARVKRLRSSPKNGTWLVIGFLLHRATLIVSVVTVRQMTAPPATTSARRSMAIRLALVRRGPTQSRTQSATRRIIAAHRML